MSGPISRIFYRCVDWNRKCPKHRTKSMSHLLQMRGLKQIGTYNKDEGCCRIFYRCVDWNKNLAIYPTILSSRIFYRCVDWNCYCSFEGCWLKVASFTDAWIETLEALPVVDRVTVASFTDAWIETLFEQSVQQLYRRRIFYRCVDWNYADRHVLISIAGRIFYRCVDWNLADAISKRKNTVASFTDAWIETHNPSANLREDVVASFTDAWIET